MKYENAVHGEVTQNNNRHIDEIVGYENSSKKSFRSREQFSYRCSFG